MKLTKCSEYNIPYNEAKELMEFKGIKNKDDSVLVTCRELLSIYSENDYYTGGLVVLEFGNISIELNVTEKGDSGEVNVLDLFVCTKTINGWMSYGFANYIITKNDLTNWETLEKRMYSELMKFAKINELHWNTLN